MEASVCLPQLLAAQLRASLGIWAASALMQMLSLACPRAVPRSLCQWHSVRPALEPCITFMFSHPWDSNQTSTCFCPIVSGWACSGVNELSEGGLDTSGCLPQKLGCILKKVDLNKGLCMAGSIVFCFLTFRYQPQQDWVASKLTLTYHI